VCGVAGILALHREVRPDPATVAAMLGELVHRGPDDEGTFLDDAVGLGFRRLSIIDPAGARQPIRNEDGSVVLVCNGEIFNYRQLRSELAGRGHRFSTGGDVEVIVHLYEEHGVDLVRRLRGQFAFALYDRRARRLMLARDHLGILPMFYTRTPDQLVFGSEIKAVLRHPAITRRVDLTGLDQLLTFPGVISPRTMFAGISSLPPGHHLVVEDGRVRVGAYWDIDYPLLGDEAPAPPEHAMIDELRSVLTDSVRRRLQSDVPVGVYLSGGLDSAMVAALAHELTPDHRRDTFSVTFAEPELDESRYQRLMAEKTNAVHHEVPFGSAQIAERFTSMIWHAESPVRETYNTCSMALAQAARAAEVKVVLAGEGADELFGGYPGYGFDRAGLTGRRPGGLAAALEDDSRVRLWGDPKLFYERDYHAWSATKRELYAPALAESFADFDCRNEPPVDPARLGGRHPLHQRSYLDLKLRLADHLLADHGDRMAMAHSVEARYPFLDVDVVEFAARVPPALAVTDREEKYLLRRAAEGLVPVEIAQRQKFGFRAQGSTVLLRHDPEWARDMLAPDRVRRQGYFDAGVVQHLVDRHHAEPDVHPHIDDDLLLVVLSFAVFLDLFDLPDQ
jgi:asparagine synthase (glutamine-hydrolysing)